MSYTRKQTVVKKFCKVCQDAGKSESEYTSHFVRDSPGPNGKVICPTLLSQNCRGCGISGHTYKYCPSTKQQVREDRNEQRWKQAEEKLIQSVKVPQQKKEVKEFVVKSGKYASILLSSSSDEEEDDAPNQKIAHKKARIMDEDEVIVPVVQANTYASRLMAPAPPKVETSRAKFLDEVVKEPEPVVEVAQRSYTKEEKEEIKEEIKKFVNKAFTTKCSWDDSSSSDDEDEEEEEEKPVIPQAPKVLKPIVLKSVKPVVEKIEEKDMPIIRREKKPVEVKKPTMVKQEVEVKKPVVKQEVMQIEFKDAWSDDEF
jgi:hypothetical protein